MNKVRVLSKIIAGIVALSIAAPALTAFACTTVIVGKNATKDGSTIIARNEDMDSAWPKHFVVRPAKDNADGAVYKSNSNNFTCSLPKHQYKYTATPDWDGSGGLFEEAGINELGVAMSATESASPNGNILKADPFDEKNGIQEDSMLTVVLPYIKTAREGVERLGDIVTKQGAGEGNGIIFSDKNEVWYMEIGSGHEWVAARVPDNAYAVVANQLSIQNIDFNDSKNFMYSSDIQTFVEKNKLNPDKKDKFIFRDIFGTSTKSDALSNVPRVWDGQRILSPSQTKSQKITSKNIPMFRTPDAKVTVADVEKVLSSRFNGTKYDITGKDYSKYRYRPINVPSTMESHIIQLRPNLPNEISGIQWLALASPETSVYVPFYAGITAAPTAYSTSTGTSDSDSAYWTYRTTAVLAIPHYNEFLSSFIKPVQDVINKQFSDNIAASDKEAVGIYNSNPDQLADYLNKEGQKNADLALSKFKDLNAELLKYSTSYLPLYNSDYDSVSK